MNADQMSGMIVGGIAATIAIISTIYYIFQVIANWKIFTKAGEKGWKTLIPFYNLYIQYKLTWKPVMAIPVILLLSFYGLTTNNADINGIVSLLGSLAGIVGGVLNIIGLHHLSKSFGKGVGFTVGLIFLSPIFYMILGFGKAQYIGNTTQQ